jgi:YD repeat-containing protein
MKKTLFVALLACFTLVFTSCNKEKELPGTSWKTHTVVDQDMTMQGITAHLNMTIDGTMKFTDATNGSMTLASSGTISAMGMSFPMDSEAETTAFTYTFDGESGTLTATVDGETSTIPFTYDKKENTILITMNEKDEETGMEMNFEMVFTEE